MKAKFKLVTPVGPQDHVQGDQEAPLTLVEYGDFECPHCLRAHIVVKALQKHFGKNLRYVFRNFPLSQIHPNAELAAEAAEASGAQGQYWKMHDAIFENQQALDPELILALGKKLAPDPPRFVVDLENGTFKGKVRQDFLGGVESGVKGTPTFFINGEHYDGPWSPADLFIEALVEAGNRRSTVARGPSHA